MKLKSVFSVFFLSLLAFASFASAQTTWIVDQAGGGDFLTIQEGIDAASNGDTVLVKDGTYTGSGNKNLDFGGKAITVKSENGAENTIIDCENNGGGFYFHSGETASAILIGFTIRNGYWTNIGGITFEGGSSPTIDNCRIENCRSATLGGGICCSSSSPIIVNCAITGNSGSGWGGGGIYCIGSSPIITNCTISGNTAWNGGGIYSDNSSPTITNCTINGNSAPDGAGIYCVGSSSPTIRNCAISGNNAGMWGGGILCHNSPTIRNCTIKGNTAAHGGGIYSYNNANPSMSNSIVWENSAVLGQQLYIGKTANPSSFTISYSDVQGGESGVYVEVACTLNWLTGNIDSDPLFVTGPLGNYYLSQIAAGQGVESPCVNSGDPTTDAWGWASLTTRTDQEFDTGNVDMGYHYPLLCTDEDEDGYSIEGAGCGEIDCDDSNPDVNPGAEEVCENGIDDDCDGDIDGSDSDCKGYSSAANAEAATYGSASLPASGSFNALILSIVPVGAVILLRILRRKRKNAAMRSD